MKEIKVEPYYPVYHRHPNKFLRYEEKRFDHGNGITGTLRIAHFLDKKGNECEMTAQVIWDK